VAKCPRHSRTLPERIILLNDLNDVSIFSDLRERLSRVTPEQIASVARKLEPTSKKDAKRVIGIIESDTTRALYVLFRNLGAERMLEKALAETTTDEIAEKDHLQKAALLDMFEDVAREIFWAQARVDLGFYEEANVGIRSGWRLIREPEDSRPPMPQFFPISEELE
jgi:hypothetical protein